MTDERARAWDELWTELQDSLLRSPKPMATKLWQVMTLIDRRFDALLALRDERFQVSTEPPPEVLEEIRAAARGEEAAQPKQPGALYADGWGPEIDYRAGVNAAHIWRREIDEARKEGLERGRREERERLVRMGWRFYATELLDGPQGQAISDLIVRLRAETGEG